jgi:hypothetical protein
LGAISFAVLEVVACIKEVIAGEIFHERGKTVIFAVTKLDNLFEFPECRYLLRS